MVLYNVDLPAARWRHVKGIGGGFVYQQIRCTFFFTDNKTKQLHPCWSWFYPADFKWTTLSGYEFVFFLNVRSEMRFVLAKMHTISAQICYHVYWLNISPRLRLMNKCLCFFIKPYHIRLIVVAERYMIIGVNEYTIHFATKSTYSKPSILLTDACIIVLLEILTK